MNLEGMIGRECIFYNGRENGECTGHIVGGYIMPDGVPFVIIDPVAGDLNGRRTMAHRAIWNVEIAAGKSVAQPITVVGRLQPGLYRLHWKNGGQSCAAVGVLADGRNWFAPVNWQGRYVEQCVFTEGDSDGHHTAIIKAERIDT